MEISPSGRPVSVFTLDRITLRSDAQFWHFTVVELKQQASSQSHLSGAVHTGLQSVVAQPHVVQHTALAACMQVGSHTLDDASDALASGFVVALQTLATHVVPEPQVPQSSTALQPSEMRPQFFSPNQGTKRKLAS